MSTYHDGTYRIIHALQHDQLDMSESNGSIVLTVSAAEFRASLPQTVHRAEMVLTRIQRKGETKKALATKLNTEPSILSAAVSRRGGRSFPRNVVLASLFWMDPIPTPEEANHVLMELELPGLFFCTYRQRENRRNWLLHSVLLYAQSCERCPCGSWLDFANAILLYCDQPLIATKKYAYAPTEPLSDELRTLAQSWNRQADELTPVDFSIKRNQYLALYRQKHGLTEWGGRQKAIQRIHESADIPLIVVNDMFGNPSNKNSNVAREWLIAAAAELGCTYRQTNELLIEGNRALLYPNKSSLQELQCIRRMLSQPEN